MRAFILRALPRLTFPLLLAAVIGLFRPAAVPYPLEKELRKKQPSAADTAMTGTAEPVSAASPVFAVRKKAATVPEADAARPADRYEALSLTDEDLTLLARLIWLEARGEPWEGQVAVAEVVLNRVLSPDFPDTVEAVIFQPGQFTPARRIPDTEAGETQYLAAAEAADGTDCVLDADVLFFAAVPQNSRIAAVIGSHYFCAI